MSSKKSEWETVTFKLHFGRREEDAAHFGLSCSEKRCVPFFRLSPFSACRKEVRPLFPPDAGLLPLPGRKNYAAFRGTRLQPEVGTVKAVVRHIPASTTTLPSRLRIPRKAVR